VINLYEAWYSKAKRGLALMLIVVLVIMDTRPVYAQKEISETEIATEDETETEAETVTEIETETEAETETEIETEAETENEVETETEIAVLSASEEVDDTSVELTKENLSNPDNYMYGWYKSWGGTYATATSSLCSTKYYRVTEDEYIVNISDSRITMDISEYDQNQKWLKHSDKITDGSTFAKQSATEYIMITIRSSVWGVNLLSLLEDGLWVEFVSPKEEETIEDIEEIDGSSLVKENLSNPDNYIYGWYKSWGGTYDTSTSMICSKDYYKATADTYYIYINDSRIMLNISEYDADKKWLKHTDKIYNGSTFTKQEKTEYIMLSLSSTVWGVKPMTLMENGLEIEFMTTPKDASELDVVVDIANADFANTDNWKAGTYSSQTGAFGIDTTKICYAYYLKVESVPYIVSLPDGYLKMNIIEIDDEGNVVKNTDLNSGQKWEKNEATSKIGITVYATQNTSSYNASVYKELIKAYSQFGLIKYQPAYTASGSMSNLTATAFVKAMNVGWNLGNSLDSKGDSEKRGEDAQLKQELNWGNPYITKDLIDYVAQSGFNTIRIPVTWYYNTYTDENGNLHAGQKWLERVQEVVDYAMANDMYVILNTHHEQPILYAGVSDEEMAQVIADAENLWLDIAEYFKDYDEHLIFESYNEIDNTAKSWNYSDTAAAQMNQMNQVFVDAVRSTGGNNANRILMVPTLLDGTGDNYYNAFTMPTDTATDRIVVTVHEYTKVFNQDVEGFFGGLEQFSNTIGAPIIVGEFGTTSSYPLEDFRTAQASNFVARAAEHGIKCIWWDNGSDYAIVDRRNLSGSDTAMINALMDGAKGIAYEVTDELVYDDISYYELLMPNLTTGSLEKQYWGTLTTCPDNGAIPVKAGDNCMITLTTLGDAADIWLQRIVFYDAEGNYISGKELQRRTYIFEVPENAAYMRVSMNSAYRTITLKEYTSYLSAGDLKLGISIPTNDNVKQVKLMVK
jgi:aryl-phospho-beta-D-glucosidase BglC (GH1 family)